MATTKLRKIQKIITGVNTTDGAGVNLTRIIGTNKLDNLDPFLLLDEFSSDDSNDYIAGFPLHPHRGFETITYMLNGKFRHKDTLGNEGYLTNGSVQWMTAGKGIIHSEMPEQTDGLLRGFQLWLNLPKKKKMIKPSYQDIPLEKIPVINLNGLSIKIISGSFSGLKGPGNPHTEMLYFDITLDENSQLNIPIKEHWNGFFYIYEGDIFCEEQIQKGYLGVLDTIGNFRCTAGKKGSKLLLIAGKPLNEPISRGGPFVMNTSEEILQAFKDYYSGNLV